ncbi:Tyrosyl-tRNA synthetase [uncultured virus]|nr:Tyrosyl-tRNA synthetase [uncultured virus]
MNSATRSQLIYRNLAEVIGRERLDGKLETERDLVCYIGFAPTGKIHVGYLVPCMKIRDLTLANCNIVIMIADVHAVLDERKTPKHLVELRSDYYRKVLSFILEMIGTNMNRITFVRGSEFQTGGDYMMDVLELAGKVTISAAKKAGSEVVKQDKDPKLGIRRIPLRYKRSLYS